MNEAKDNVSKKALLEQISKYAVGVGVPAVLYAISTAIFTRLFDAESYGMFMVVMTTVNIIVAFSGQWLQQPIGRYVSSSPPVEVVRYLSAIWLGLGIVLIVLLIAFSIAARLDWGGAEKYKQFLVPALLLVVLQLLITNASVVLQARMNVSAYSIQQVSIATGRLFVPVVLLYFFSFGKMSLAWGYVVAAFVVLPLSLRRSGLCSALSVDAYGFSVRWSTLKEMAVYGLPMMAWFAATNILSMSDRFIIGYFKGPGEVGIYAASYSLMNGTVGLITAPILSATWPFLMRAWGSGNVGEAGLWLGKIASFVLVGGLVLVGGAMVTSNEIAVLFLGDEFREGAVIMPVVVLGMVVFSVSTYVHKPFEFYGKTGKMVLFALISCFSTVFLNVVYVPIFGYKAAAVSALIGYLIYAGLAAYFGRRLMLWKWNVRLLFVSLIAVIVSVFFARFLIDSLVIGNVLLQFFGAGFAYLFCVCLCIGGCYPGVVLRFLKKRFERLV